MMNMTDSSSSISTYGAQLFWNYLREQFDFNNQTIRRTIDILANETAGPLLKANNFPHSIFAVINNTGSSFAFKKALKELFNKDIRDVWNDFSISLVLLRNNTSIPVAYRHKYPYWTFNSQYVGYPTIFSNYSQFNSSQYASWWEMMENNGTIPANWGTPYTGQTVVRTLPSNFSANVKNLMTLSFNVPKNLSTVTVTVTAGEWRITLLQFTSDGTPVGSFILDGPHAILNAGVHVFNIATHVPAFTPTGNIRLVCCNVTFSGTGNQLSEYYSSEGTSGSISIVSTV
jgi:hypothetical protein